MQRRKWVKNILFGLDNYLVKNAYHNSKHMTMGRVKVNQMQTIFKKLFRGSAGGIKNGLNRYGQFFMVK